VLYNVCPCTPWQTNTTPAPKNKKKKKKTKKQKKKKKTTHTLKFLLKKNQNVAKIQPFGRHSSLSHQKEELK
jgi:hypothetical protein